MIGFILIIFSISCTKTQQNSSISSIFISNNSGSSVSKINGSESIMSANESSSIKENSSNSSNSSSKPSSSISKVATTNNSGVFYVATNGNDSNDGTINKPLKTIDAAKIAVSEYLERVSKLTKDVYVYIRGGTYISPYTLLFSSSDSGKDGKNIIYSAYQNEAVTISSGIILNNWTKADGEFSGVTGVYKTKLPDDENDIFCLYEDNVRAYPARHPNIIENKPQYLKLASGTNPGSLQARVNKTELPAGADYKYAQMVLWPGSHNDGAIQFNWYSSVDPIVSYNTTAGAFKLAYPTWWDMTIGNRYYVQNVKKFIDAKGEFFFDRGTREIYYKPYGDISKVSVLAPTRATSIYFSGDPDSLVQNIVLTNLKVGNSNFGESFSQASDAKRFEGMIKLENATNIKIDNCHLFNSGYNAVSMYGINNNNSVTNCLIENCGIGGVMIGMEYSQLPNKLSKATDGQISKDNIVKNNIIRNVGQTSPGHGYGVFLHQSGYNTVTKNTFYKIPKGGVNLYNTQTGYLIGTTVGGVTINDNNAENYKYCRSNEVSFNEIFDAMNDGSDCGAIITYGTGYGNLINNNFIHDNPSLKDAINMGIYLDDNSDGTVITNNIVARLGGGYWINGAMLKGRDITLKNNIFYNTRSNYGVISTMITRVATWGMPQERTHDFISENNIVYEDKPISYLYYHWGFNYNFTTIKKQNNNTYFLTKSPTVGYANYGADNSGKDDTWTTANFATHQQTMLSKGVPIDSNVSWSDPLFTSPTTNNFTLDTSSPSLALGFKQIKMTGIGVDYNTFPFKDAAAKTKSASKVKNNN